MKTICLLSTDFTSFVSVLSFQWFLPLMIYLFTRFSFPKVNILLPFIDSNYVNVKENHFGTFIYISTLQNHGGDGREVMLVLPIQVIVTAGCS